MPDSSDANLSRPVRRRTVLVRAFTAALVSTLPAAGCTRSSAPAGAAPVASPSPPPPEPALVEGLLADKREVLARYAAVAETHPALRQRLAPLAAEHEAHAQALQALLAAPPPAAPPPAPPPPSAAPGLAGRGATLTALAARERELADSRVGALLAAPPEFARLLAAIGAAEAAHAALLPGP